MQLSTPHRTSSLRSRLSAAACVLLASAAPTTAHAGPDATPAEADSDASWQLDGTALLYGERNRADIVEPIARITRLFPGGRTLSAQLAIDAMTGASPSGAVPSNNVQTTTSASGTTQTSSSEEVPTGSFRDLRGALDLDWLQPIGRRLTSTTGVHYSREKDYQSRGANAGWSVDLMHRLTTLTVGGGINEDRVFPVGGIPDGLSTGSVLPGTRSDAKRVTSGMVGVSRIVTRRWMMGANVSHTFERGYLTDPYKVLSLVDPVSGESVDLARERRPATRRRTDVLASSVYHLTQDVLYLSYRYYWDDWGVRSSTADLKYRRDLSTDSYLQPHLRLYAQAPADFFRAYLIQGVPLPSFASSDLRLGALKTVTLGLTYGFRLPDHPGTISLRGEYIRQWGRGHPQDAFGALREVDLYPPVDIGSILVGYSVAF
jgi:hypothetical protein